MSGRFNVQKDKSSNHSGVEEIVDIDDEIIDVDEITPASPKHTERRPRAVSNGDVEEDELSQPYVDIHELFNMYNHKHFGGRITNTYVEYSTRMTLCAGTCTFKGPLGGCRIALSEPLLKFRPRSDLLSTLLHEMIHALLFVTEGVSARDGVDGHGPKFMAHAERVNQAERGSIGITPYHTFRDEVDIYRVHHWTCNRCSMLIKRAMNRAPAPRDPFWPPHEKKCGGEFIKTKEPEKKKKVMKRAPKRRAVAVDPSTKGTVELPTGVMRTRRIDSMLSSKLSQKSVKAMVACPVCNVQVAKLELNEHLDKCLTPDIFSQDPADEVCIPDSDDELERKRPAPARSGQNGRKDSEADAVSQVQGEISQIGECPNERGAVKPSSLKRPRKEYDFLKQMIPDPDILMSLAVDPFSVKRESLRNGFNIPDCNGYRKQEETSNDVISILKPFIQDESPYQLQQKARAQMLRHIGKGAIVKEVVIHELAEQRGMDTKSFFEALLSKAKRGKDGSYVISNDSLRRIQAGPNVAPASPSTHPTDSIEMEEPVPKRSRPPSSNDFVSRPSTRESNQTGGGFRYVNRDEGSARDTPKSLAPEKTKDRMESCPVCDISVARSQLEEHVNKCLNDTDVAPLIFTGDDASESAGALEAQPQQTRRSEAGVTASGSGAVAQPRCPLCDLAMARGELESHVAACMLSEGLEDVF